MLWQKISDNGWKVRTDREVLHIFPKGKDGKSLRVTIIRNHLWCRHDNGAEVHFKRFLHRGTWHWHRNDQPRTERQIMENVARMLFAGDMDKSRDLLVRVAFGQELVPA